MIMQNVEFYLIVIPSQPINLPRREHNNDGFVYQQIATRTPKKYVDMAI